MSRFGMSCKIKGDKRMMRKLASLPMPLDNLMTEVVTYGEGQARQYAMPHRVDRGELARSIESKIEAGSPPPSATIFTKKEYAQPAEYGRGPGRQPPFDPIQDWARRHGVGEYAWAIVKSIARKGTKGIFFMKRAREDIIRRLPGFTQKAVQEIEGKWTKR